MNFIESIQTCYKKFFDFSGRASKSEYWWFQLYNAVIYVLTFVFQGDLTLLFSILVIANIIPTYAAAVRRIHDSDKSDCIRIYVNPKKTDTIYFVSKNNKVFAIANRWENLK